jgi:glutathione S-transferase
MPRSFPVLYSFRRCPYAIRTRITLCYARIQCEIREIKLSHKPLQMLEVSPKGTVPVLILPCGTVIDESLDIMQWALKQNDPDKWLCDENKSDCDFLIKCNDTVFKQALDRYKYPSRYPNDESAEAREICLEILQDLDTRLSVNNMLLGHNISLADVAIFPFIRQFASVDKNWFDTLSLPYVQKWLNTYLRNPFFINVMQKYNPWQCGDTPVLFLEVR